jgi:hypothetical protein
MLLVLSFAVTGTAMDCAISICVMYGVYALLAKR